MRCRGLVAALSLVVALAQRTEPTARKAGFSGFLNFPNATCDDAKLLSLDDSWFYDWTASSSKGNYCGEDAVLAKEFVPMVNGVGEAENMVTSHYQTAWTAANCWYLLGYNEPDFGNGHNHPHQVSPADAAADWPDVQAVAAQMDPPLQLVAPAVSSGAESGGTDAWDEDGRSTWLDQFLGNCSEVVAACDPAKIVHIAMHDYTGNVTKLERRINGAAERYGRPVWLTEFAITVWGQPPSRSEQDAFLTDAIPMLEKNSNVFRYNWFTSRNQPNAQNGGSNQLPWDSNSTVLTSTGAIYASAP